MRFKIFDNGIEINRIASSLEFCQDYCSANGYTYEEELTPEPEPMIPTPTELEQLRADVDYLSVMTGVDLV